MEFIASQETVIKIELMRYGSLSLTKKHGRYRVYDSHYDKANAYRIEKDNPDEMKFLLRCASIFYEGISEIFDELNINQTKSNGK